MKLNIKNLVITAMMLGLGLILPTLFHMIAAGAVMLPMHIPVLITGLVCGPLYGAFCGAVLPLLSSLITGMPPIFPTAVSMVFELCTYGMLTGLLYRKLSWNIYPSMIASMLSGRAVAGVANAILYGMAGKAYTFEAFLTASFVTGLPGIIIQLTVIPVIVFALIKTKLVERPVRQEMELLS